MPIDTDSMLMRLAPLAPINLGGLGGGSMERQRLELMRKQFEETKRQNREQSELRRLGEANEMARANLTAENQRKQQEAAALAEHTKTKLAAELKFAEMGQAGDVQGQRAFVPYMRSAGKGAELLGEEGGLPAYRLYDLDKDGNEIVSDADRLAAAAGAGPAPRPSDEVYGATEEDATQSLARLNAVTGAQDDTGDGTPSNVIDMGAMADSTLARLRPMFASQVQAYPEEYRGSAQKTAEAVEGASLPFDKSVDMFKSLRTSPDNLITSGIEAGAQQGRFDQTRQAAKERTANTQYERGWTAAKQAAATYNVDDLISARDQTRNAIEIINNGDPTDDHLVLALISRRMGERGATTEGDIKRVTGKAAMSWLNQAKTWLETGIEGGFTRDQKNALVGVLQAMNESDDRRFTTYLDKIEEEGGDDPERAKGMREYGRIVVPKDIREAREAKKKTASAGTGSGFDMELDAQSHASGLDPNKVRGIIKPESGGDPGAVNPQSGASGLIQFLPKVAESLGTTIEEVRKMTAEQQIPLVMKYLSERGITKDSTAGDYYMAVAAPAFIGKADSEVVYAKGSKEWEQNPAWRPKDGGDITVGDIKRYGGGKKDEAVKAVTGAASRARELLRKGGY